MKRVLIVEDTIDIMELLVFIMEEGGHKAVGITDAGEVNIKMEEFSPNLIILDVQLGHHDGRLICKELKSARKTADIPIVMISASHSLTSLNAVGCFPDIFITKPFDIIGLLDQVDNLLLT